jgi:hypothetical protein
MQLIPPALVPTVRAYLQQQGLNPNTIAYDGSLDAGGIVSNFYNQVTVRTAVTPDLVFPINQSGEPPNAVAKQLLDQLQPTVIISGPAGSFVLAPYGQAVGQRSWLPIAAVGLGAVVFIGWAIFGK